ncbi:ribonuclease III domain-containing protein [Cytidiella melzeri]|nr:ribonuclease III domain-containing protein [Cytidiella melzeri]
MSYTVTTTLASAAAMEVDTRTSAADAAVVTGINVANGTVGVAGGRVGIKPRINPADLPPLPKIKSDELRKQVFTHRSYFARPTHVFEDSPYDPSPDNEMLEHLGDAVLSMVVTGLLREVYPYLRVGPSTKIRALVVGNNTLAVMHNSMQNSATDSSVMYNLPDNLFTHPAQAITLRASTNIQADLFEAYVGGVYLDAGLEGVQAWLVPLFRHYLVEAYRQVRMQHGLSPDPTPVVTPPMGSLAPGYPGPSAQRVTPMAPAGHLSLFNQCLQQKNKAVEWEYSGSAGQGTKTTPIWVVRAIVDHECLGRGRGSTKKAAKNEAAKEGLSNMGVYVPG